MLRGLPLMMSCTKEGSAKSDFLCQQMILDDGGGADPPKKQDIVNEQFLRSLKSPYFSISPDVQLTH